MNQGTGPDAQAALEEVLQADRGRLLAALIRDLGSFQLAEDCLQEAALAALRHWGRSGVPDKPVGWLLKAARRKGIDQFRRDRRFAEREADIALLMERDAEPMPQTIPDERLRLIFTCCHPALEPKAQVALTLRTLGGLTTPEIARAFLDRETAMGQRISRAKSKIRDAGIAYKVPDAEDLPARLGSVLAVVYLIFNQGYSVQEGARDLCREAIWLGRLIDRLRPGEAEIEGLLALMLITHARAEARKDARGAMIALAEQDPRAWDGDLLREGLALLDRAVARGQGGPFQIKAAISACHVQGRRNGATDWRQIVMLYDALMRHEPTDVVRLNRAVALAEIAGPEVALRALEPLAGTMTAYQPFHAAQAALLSRAGMKAQAEAAYDRAIDLAPDEATRDFLSRKRSEEPKKKAEQ